jgi:glucokinase
MHPILIDWSAVPQYVGDPMTEVLRSKLFYARSAVMVAIPTFCHLSNLPPIDVGILKTLLAAASKVAASRFLSGDGLLTHAILDAILAKGRYASQEYFGR